jgi:hypothetical protein
MAIVLNRATVVYIIIFLCFCVGIWVVLSMGTTYLVAPPDLTGKWRSQETDLPANSFTIAQSGEFIQLNLDHGPQLDLRLTNWQGDQGKDTVKPLKLEGSGGWIVTLTPASMGNSYQFNFQPPAGTDPKMAGTWRCQRGDRPIRATTAGSPPN